MQLDRNVINLTFTNGLASSGTIICDCFIMYEFDVKISQVAAIVTNKYNDFTNGQTK